MIAWFLTHEDVFVWVSLGLHTGSAVLYLTAGKYDRAVYFTGAVILTIGVLMR